jgi:hypothetical protein
MTPAVAKAILAGMDPAILADLMYEEGISKEEAERIQGRLQHYTCWGVLNEARRFLYKDRTDSMLSLNYKNFLASFLPYKNDNHFVEYLLHYNLYLNKYQRIIVNVAIGKAKLSDYRSHNRSHYNELVKIAKAFDDKKMLKVLRGWFIWSV